MHPTSSLSSAPEPGSKRANSSNDQTNQKVTSKSRDTPIHAPRLLFRMKKPHAVVLVRMSQAAIALSTVVRRDLRDAPSRASMARPSMMVM